jgi:hypothetical protein
MVATDCARLDAARRARWKRKIVVKQSKHGDTLLRVYEAGEQATVQLPDDVTRVRAGFWGSILALVAEEVARAYAARGEGREKEVLAQIQCAFAAELRGTLAARQVMH